MESMKKYKDQVDSLKSFIIDIRIDISSHEKFISAFTDWYKMQVYMSKKMSEMDFVVLSKILLK